MGSSVSRRPRRRVIGTRRARWLAVCLAVITVLFLVLAATALAYVPGQRIWVKTMGTAASEAGAWDVATGPNGVVCVGGWKDASGSPDGVAFLRKYSSAGKVKWTRTYRGLGSAEVESIAFDAKGNVYVSGTTWGAEDDIFVAKYSASGVRKWVKTYDNKGLADWSEAIAVDRAGNVYVAGHSKATSNLEGIVVLKYSTAGTPKWAARFDPDLNDPDQGSREINVMRIDGSGNAYVAADAVDSSVHSALTFKVATSDGSIPWSKTYRGKDGSGAAAYGIAVRGRAVVVCGEASKWADNLMDLLVLRYDLAGKQKSVLEYSRSASTDDWADDVALDASGNAYVTGAFVTMPAYHPSSCAILKVSAAGAVKWARGYLPRDKHAEGWYVRLDAYGNVFVAGASYIGNPFEDVFLTMKYSASGVRKWVKTWTPAGRGLNEPDGLALGTNGGVYVAGQAEPRGDYYQAVLVKYQR